MKANTRTDGATNLMPHNFLNPDNYIEKPRPNFYNVIKKLREIKVKDFFKIIFHFYFFQIFL